jgi:putative hydrolase of the HAD superfamily
VPIRAVFFDVFGTLMPYKDLPRNIILSRRAQLAGMDVSPERMQEAMDQLVIQNKGFAMAGQLGGEDVPRDRAYWVRTFASLLAVAGVHGDLDAKATDMCDTFLVTEDFYLDDDTLPTLRGLRERGYFVGAISNAPKGLAKTLDKYGVLPALDFAVGSQDIGIEKPNPAIFHYALQATMTAAADAAYVGDEYMTDACAAQAVGMLGIYLDRNNHRPASDVPHIRRLTDLIGVTSPLHGRD